MNKSIKERLYVKVNDAIDSLESRDINGTLLILEGLKNLSSQFDASLQSDRDRSMIFIKLF